MITVNICMITYNHQEYIAEAIEGVLKQVVNFKITLIIGEDCSTDKTRNICEEYAKKNPDKIKLLAPEKNLGMMQNFVRTMKECDGKYVAYIEGDDYWIDNFKLQKQVDFLEANPDFSSCFHNVIIKEERTGELQELRNLEKKEWVLHNSLNKDIFSTEDVLGPWFIPSPSLVFLNYADFKLPNWFYNCVYGDLPFMLLLTLRGKLKYVDEVMAVYRIHDGGMSAVHKVYDKIMVMVYVYASFDIHTKYEYHTAIRNAVMYEVDRHIPKKENIHFSKQSIEVSLLKNVYRKIVAIFYKSNNNNTQVTNI
jgi:glycosyltransferase involved in cell wall biosynthesis